MSQLPAPTPTLNPQSLKKNKILEFDFRPNKQFSILSSEFKGKGKHLYGVFLALENILQFPFPLS